MCNGKTLSPVEEHNDSINRKGVIDQRSKGNSLAKLKHGAGETERTGSKTVVVNKRNGGSQCVT